MNEIGPEQLLSQIRSLNRTLNSTQPESAAAPASFGNLLKDTLDSVNETQRVSRDMKQAFTAGTSDASLAEVMIASEKASISFRAVTEVRNKLVQAYQDIMNMPV
ncbi:MAG: flagellar hook-basal body complex protein FliE [Pseudomonadota bacterium]